MLVRLTKDVTFDVDDKVVTIPQDTEVYLDSQKGIAYHKGEHFFLFPDEYAPLN